MKQSFCLIIVVVFLFGASVVQASVQPGTLVSINCSDASSISFSIYIPDIDEWEGPTDERSWSLNQIPEEECEPTFNQSSSLVSYTNINASVCAPGNPSITPDNSTFEYVFSISVDAVAGSATFPVTFAYDHVYTVSCFYNREQESIMTSFQPGHSLTDNSSDTAEFVITFTVHLSRDNSEVDSIIDLRTPVYGKVMITDDAGVPEYLDVHLRQVVADTDNTTGGDDEYLLIENGCAESPVVTSTSCDIDSEVTFGFDIFRYPFQTTDDSVYLRAAVIVCLSDNLASVCRTECTACLSGRKRRETLEQIQQTEYYVTAGPFQIRKPDQESEPAVAGKEERTTPLPAYVIAVVAVCAVLAVAVVGAVVLIVFRRRRQSVATFALKNEDFSVIT